MGVSEKQQHFHFGVEYPFKYTVQFKFFSSLILIYEFLDDYIITLNICQEVPLI